MKSVIAVVALVTAASLLATACGGGNQQQGNADANMPMPAPAPAPAATPPAGSVEIGFKSEPDPPKMGGNTFDVMVMSGGQPVTDADVSVEFFMPAMPSMKMPEMRNTIALTHEGNGRYRGTGNVMMAGSWDATVSVRHGGQVIGSRKFPVTAN